MDYKQFFVTGMKGLVMIIVGSALGAAAAQIPALIQEYRQQTNVEAIIAYYNGQVVLFGTATCPYCKQGRAIASALGVKFLDLDIEHDPVAKAQFERLGARGVPVLIANGERVNGFDEAKWKVLLSAHPSRSREVEHPSPM